MNAVDTISAVLIAVPARDEQHRVVQCVQSLLDAVSLLPPGLAVSIVVTSDGSRDRTDALLAEIAATEPSVLAVPGHWGSAGGARRAAVHHGLAWLASNGHTDTSSIWIATTDADSEVPSHWLVRHLAHAEAGHDAIAGIVELSDDDDRTAEVLATFADNYLVGPDSHPHVHGANLGIRASAYLAAGGFPELIVAEDHALWNELRRQKFRVRSPIDVSVFTSGRLRGRAPGGFADTMAEWVEAVA